MFRFVVAVCTHALPHDRHDRKVHGADDDNGDEVHAARHAVCGNLRRAEHGNDACHQHTPQRKETVFNRIWNCDFQNAAQHLKVAAENVFRLEVDLVLCVERKRRHDDARHRAGQKRRHRNACNARFQHENTDCVAGNVDDVHEERNVHGHVRLFHGAKKCRRRIVNTEERERKRRDEHIGFRRLQDAFFCRTVQKVQNLTVQSRADDAHHAGSEQSTDHQLPRRAVRIFLLLVAEVLRNDDRAARCKCR